MTYRDERLALETRCAALESELQRLTARATEYAALAAQVARVEAELADARRRLQEAPPGRRLALLDDLAIASPCHASWEKMVGDARVRHCGECRKDVYNLSAMAREEAESLLRERVGEVCVRLYRRADGTVLTQDCPVGLRWRKRRARVVGVVVAGVASAFALTALASFTMMGRPARLAQGAAPMHAEPPSVATMGAAPMPTEVPPPADMEMGQAIAVPNHAPAHAPAHGTVRPGHGPRGAAH